MEIKDRGFDRASCQWKKMSAHTDKPCLPAYEIKTRMIRLYFLVLSCSLFIYEYNSKVSEQSMEKIKSYMRTKTIVA